MVVIVLQGCKSTPQKRHAVHVANVYSYKLGKNEFQFLCKLGAGWVGGREGQVVVWGWEWGWE